MNEASSAGGLTFATVIVAYGSAASIAEVVQAAAGLRGCTEVVVVDNGSDGAADVAAAAGAAVIRRPDNPGFGAGQNAGVARTSAPAVLLLNPDASLHAAGVDAGLALLAACPDVAGVQGTITNRVTNAPERSMGSQIRPIHLFGRALALRRLLTTRIGRWLARRVRVADHVKRVPSEPEDVEVLAATAVLLRRSAFDDIGGFDETYFLYGEDLDLCHRLRIAGWRLVGIPVSWADHDSGGTADSSWSRELHWWRGTLSFAARWWRGAAWRGGQIAGVLMWVRLMAGHPRGARSAWVALAAGPAQDRRRYRRV